MIYNFYTQQFRKDMIDKLNVHDVNDLNLPLRVKISSRYVLPDRLKLNKFFLIRMRAYMELFCSQSVGIRKVSIFDNVKRRTKLAQHTFNYEFYCNIEDKFNVFNILGQIYCIFRLYRNVNFNLIFNRLKHQNADKHICSLRKLNFFYIPWFMKYVTEDDRNNFLFISFLFKKSCAIKRYQNGIILFRFLLNRLRIKRTLVKEIYRGKHII